MEVSKAHWTDDNSSYDYSVAHQGIIYRLSINHFRSLPKSNNLLVGLDGGANRLFNYLQKLNAVGLALYGIIKETKKEATNGL